MRKMKKNGFLAKFAWHHLCQEGKNAFSCTLSVLAQNFWGPKQWNQGKTIKIVVSAETGQNHQWHIFEKGDFGTAKICFLLIVFLKVVLFLKHFFRVLSVKASSCSKKTQYIYIYIFFFDLLIYICWKRENVWNIVGCFWTWQKGFYLFCFMFQDVLLFLFVSACCLVLFWITTLYTFHSFASCFLLVVFFVFALVFCYFSILGYLSKKHLSNIWKFRAHQKWKTQKRRTFWQEQLAQVCSEIVFSALSGFQVFMLRWKHNKNSGFSKQEKFWMLKIGSSIS